MTIRVCVCVLLAGALRLTTCVPVVQAQSPEPARVRVQFTVMLRDYVNGLTWTAMVEECERIWSAEGVEIGWDAPKPGEPAPDVAVPLVVDDREVGKLDRSRRQEAFGIAVFLGREQRILVSLRRVRQLLSARRTLVESDDSTARDLAAGVLLGRVVAHELGHVLLLSTTHTSDGRMSPKLTGRTLRLFDRVHFALSPAERTRMATRFSTHDNGERRADASVAVKGAP